MAKSKQQPEEVIAEGVLNEIVYVETRRPNGSLRIQQDFQYCPTMTEQHTAHLTNLNYLIERFKPDELAAYIAARAQARPEILGHDFSIEPSLQDAKNIVYTMKKSFDELPDDIKMHFKNHVEFLKFIDNPANQEKMIKLGLLKPAEIKELTGTETPALKPQSDATTKEAASKQG